MYYLRRAGECFLSDINFFSYISYTGGDPKKTKKTDWNNVLLEFECLSTQSAQKLYISIK